MPYFTEQARTHSECLEKIRSRYGDRAKVLIERTIRKGGFLGMGGHDEVEMTGTYGYAAYASADLETAKRQVLAAAGKSPPDAALQNVLREITNLGGEVRNLSEKMEATINSPGLQEKSEHPSLLRLEDDLVANDFSPGFIKAVLDRVRSEFPLNELDDYEEMQKRVVRWIGEKISIYRESELLPQDPKKKPRVIILVGPTGVGKTTTIAKLAALYGERSEGSWQHSVRLVTLDTYRIGGKQQIEKYGEIMEFPVSTVENYDGLRQILALYRQEVDFVLIDTTGKSPRNYGELGEMKTILEACPSRNAETHLCLQAATKSSDMREILKQFEPFKYKGVVITKLDETGRIGNVVSALAEEGKSVSFVTTGQTVPSDIERASVMRFLINLEGFTVDRDALTGYFKAKEQTGA